MNKLKKQISKLKKKKVKREWSIDDETRNTIIYSIIVLILGILIFCLISHWSDTYCDKNGNNCIKIDKEELNLFCKEEGYNKLTDYKYDGYDKIKIECDNIKINKTYIENKICKEKNKWGECIKKKQWVEMEE